MTTAPHIDGMVAAGFEEVRAEFEKNFKERGEIGAAVAAYVHGEKIVDLWGGRRSPKGDDPWTEDTMVVVMSTTKGLAAMTRRTSRGTSTRSRSSCSMAWKSRGTG